MYISVMGKPQYLEISTLRKDKSVLIHFCINTNWNLLIRKLPIIETQITQFSLILYWLTVLVAFSIQRRILQGSLNVTNQSYMFSKQHLLEQDPKKLRIGISKTLLKKSLTKHLERVDTQKRYLTISILERIF